MDTLEIIRHIDSEIARLQQVKTLLKGTSEKRRPGRPAVKSLAKAAKTTKRSMSPEGRARIAAAQKARWARAKVAA